MKSIENQKLPFYPELISQMNGIPDVMPEGPFAHTNLSGTENKPLRNLKLSDLKKAFLKFMKFERTEQFIKVEKGYIDEDENKLPIIKLDDYVNDTCFDGQCFLEQQLSTKSLSIGIRVSPGGDSNSPNLPFVRINHPTDKQLIKDKVSGKIIGFEVPNQNRNKYAKRTTYLLKVDDRIELFPDPKSIKRRMYIFPSTNNPKPKERKNIALGGGFTMQLKEIDPINNTITALIEATSNDVVIREIHNPKYKDHYHSFTQTMRFDQKNGFLPLHDRSKHKSTQNVINQANLPIFLRHVVDSFVNSNSKALMNVFSAGINLKPDLAIHVVKCHYATIKDEHHRPQIITGAFDFESIESEQQWHAKNKRLPYPPLPTYSLFPYDNLRQQQVIFDHKAILKEISPAEKLLLYQTYLIGLTAINPHATLQFIKDNHELFCAEAAYNTYHQHINQDLQTLTRHLPKNEIAQIMSHYQPEQGWTRNNSHHHTIGKLLETLAPQKDVPSLSRKIAKQNLTDLQTYRIATGATTENLIKPLPRDTHLASADPKTIRHLTKQLESLLKFKEHQYIPIAVIHSLREGD